MLLTLAHHPRKHYTDITYNTRASTPPTLVRYPHKQTNHDSTLATQLHQPRHQRHQRHLR